MRVLLVFALGMVLMLPLYLLGATERFSPLARLFSWLGLGLSTLPAVLLIADPRSRRNSLAATGLVIALFYHLAPFHEKALKLRWGDARISDASIESAQLLAALAVPAMWLGWYLTGALRLLRPLPHLRLEVPSSRMQTAGTLIVLWSLLLQLLWLRRELTEYQPAVSVLSVLSPIELGFAMILMPMLMDPGRSALALRSKTLFLWLFFGTAGIGLTSSMLQSFVRPLMVLLLGALLVSRKVHLVPVLAITAVIAIMQPVKGEFRQRVWDRNIEMDVTDRALLFIELLEKHWLGGELDKEVDKARSIEVAAARTGGALALANVVELTPNTVPHQLGKTYQYLLHAPVPRIIDPDKPIAQYADVWAAVMYGYTSERGTAHVMVGLSQIAECYINFGFLGGLLMLMVIGATYRAADEVFGHPGAGQGALALYIYFVLMAAINSEGSLAQHLGGVVQQFSFYAVCMALLGIRLRAPAAGTR